MQRETEEETREYSVLEYVGVIRKEKDFCEYIER